VGCRSSKLISLRLAGDSGDVSTASHLVIENLALRQQVTALKKKRPRPPLDDTDREFWVALRQSWPAWVSRLVIVNPDTVPAGIGNDSSDTGQRSRADRVQAPRIEAEIRDLISLLP
jgi:hypothetical protein